MKHFTIALLFVVFAVCGRAAGQATTKPAAATREAKVRILLVGDSTVTDSAGWGPGFKASLTDEVECVNYSAGGRSSKSYRDEGIWDKKVMATRGDYVLIQFGHNDNPGKGAARETDPKTTFPENLKRYVEEARAAGMKPVLVTSLTRRRFGEDGKIREDVLKDYAAACRKVAEEEKVPVIDLYARSLEICNRLGEEGCRTISPKAEKEDVTHLNAKGAAVIGPVVAEELGRVVPELKQYIRTAAIAK